MNIKAVGLIVTDHNPPSRLGSDEPVSCGPYRVTYYRPDEPKPTNGVAGIYMAKRKVEQTHAELKEWLSENAPGWRMRSPFSEGDKHFGGAVWFNTMGEATLFLLRFA